MTTDDAPLFPDGAAPRRGRRLAVIATAVAVAVLAAGVGASVASGEATPSLVTATAGRQDVASELHGVATIEPVVQAAVAFPAEGTVGSLDVAVGDQVVVGQQLASLDPEDLTQGLHAAEATLARAELALRSALDGEGVDTSSGADPTTAAPAAADGDASRVVWAVTTQTAGDGQLDALQQAVLDAQAEVDRALGAAAAALAAAGEVCAADDGRDAGATTGDSTTTTTTTAADDTGTDLATCRSALDQVQTAQQATASAQQELADAAAALDEHLLSQGVPGSGGTSGGIAGGTTSTPGGGATTGTASSPSAAELVALQQQVDAASLGVAVAQQAIAQATIVSPVAGTVVAIGVTEGDTVTAGSATQTVTVQGDDGMEAVTTVSLDEVAGVQVGQLATVVPDGSDSAVQGEVVAVAAVPDDDATTTSYRVTIGFADAADELGNGTIGSVTILTDEVRSALAVPTSAVTWQDGRSTVRVVVDGVVTATTVQVGVVGAEWTEIRSGIEQGDEVVLATPSDPLPGSATDSDQAGTSGGTVGGGLPAGGPPTGGPPAGMGSPPGS